MAKPNVELDYTPKIANMINNAFSYFGYNTFNTKLWAEQRRWRQWWVGDVDGFHKYSIFNGDQNVEQTRLSMQLPKQITEKWSSLCVGDRLKITATNDDDLLQKELERIKFKGEISNLVERSFAIGAGAFVEGKDELGNIWTKYILGEQIFPISSENGIIKECAFAWEEKTQKGTRFNAVLHLLDENKNYYTKEFIVKDYLGKKDKLSKSDFELYEDGQEFKETMLNSPVPLFQIMKPNVVNTVDLLNPLGISIFANALNHIKKADMIFDGEYNEFELGRKKTFVDRKLVINIPESEKSKEIQRRIFPVNTDEFYSTDFDKDGKPPIYEFNPELRIEAYEKGLNSSMKLAGKLAGFGDNYSFIKEVSNKTATEVVSDNAELQSNRNKHLQLLSIALIGMARALLWLNGKDYSQDVTIDFDDSVIEDTAAIRAQAIVDLNSGVIDVADYLVKTERLTREQALKQIKDKSVLNVSNATINNISTLLSLGLITEEYALIDIMKIPKAQAMEMLENKREQERRSLESLINPPPPDDETPEDDMDDLFDEIE